MLTEEQIHLVRRSAERLASSNVAATNAFYTNLFRTAPTFRTLFPEDMFQQSEKLWKAIVLVLQSMDDVEAIGETLEAMGARHTTYGVKPEHYGLVNDVLIDTIAALMGEEWTKVHADAWHAALAMVTKIMQRGATKIAA